MTRQARIAKLEAKHGGADTGPTVIFLCDAVTGEPGGAVIPGQGTFARHEGQPMEAFKQCITCVLAGNSGGIGCLKDLIGRQNSDKVQE